MQQLRVKTSIYANIQNVFCTSVKCNTFSILLPPHRRYVFAGLCEWKRKKSQKKKNKEHITFGSTAGTTTFINQNLLFFFSCCCLFYSIVGCCSAQHTLKWTSWVHWQCIANGRNRLAHTHAHTQKEPKQINTNKKIIFSETQPKCK